MKERNFKPARKMKPVFIVFCEGETEEEYISLLRKKYRQAVISHVTGLSISLKTIQRFIKAAKIGPGDSIKSFLMYDLDVENVGNKIRFIKSSINITSNPSIELWFLLHNSEQNAAISTNKCLEKMKKSDPVWENYKKGSLTEKQQNFLWDKRILASDRAKRLTENDNPSSLIYRLVDELELVDYPGKPQ